MKVQLVTGIYEIVDPPDAATMQRVADGERVFLEAKHRGQRVWLDGSAILAFHGQKPPPARGRRAYVDLEAERNRYRDALERIASMKTGPLSGASTVAKDALA